MHQALTSIASKVYHYDDDKDKLQWQSQNDDKMTTIMNNDDIKLIFVIATPKTTMTR